MSLHVMGPPGMYARPSFTMCQLLGSWGILDLIAEALGTCSLMEMICWSTTGPFALRYTRDLRVQWAIIVHESYLPLEEYNELRDLETQRDLEREETMEEECRAEGERDAWRYANSDTS